MSVHTVSLCCLATTQPLFSYISATTSYIQLNEDDILFALDQQTQFDSYISATASYIQLNEDDILFVLDQHTQFDRYSGSSLNKSPRVTNIASPRHIILFPSQPVFAVIY